ncbi:MAG: CTP synthetase, partial [Steroidobacteraceae bacterium]|nr:CTP synthetase [Deltaproteobacteria bacterium]
MQREISGILKLQAGPRNTTAWSDMVHRLYNPTAEVEIGLVGKYVEYEDSYKSLKEALLHGGLANDVEVKISWIEAQDLEWPGCVEKLSHYDAILVPGGFGKRGVEGMINAIRFAREHKVPYFG